MNPFVFVVGCPRSGTTLLQRMLDAHHEVAVIPETLWIARIYERRSGLTDDGLVTPKLIDKLLAKRRFVRMGIDRAELEGLLARGGRPYASFVTDVFDLYGRARGKRLVGDKSPGYVRSIPTLHGLWPDARFVHLIRDGRDVALSAVLWRKADRVLGDFRAWSGDPWTTAALWWERSVRLGREAASQLPEGIYIELRYEDLVAAPEAACRKVCAFLGVHYDAGMLCFHAGRTTPDPALPTKRQWLPPTAGLRDWRTQMPAAHLERFEAAAGELLTELGYERGAAHLSPELIARARAARETFADDVAREGRPLPARWAA
ncbi:MAG: sulfotransferase [Actinobacteria bacterium]|nr:sulfotransferase [Actinomycetota bacterium]